MNKPQTMLRFLWQIMRPYRGWLFLMFQATIIGSTYHVVNNYAIKMVIDAFSTDTLMLNAHLTWAIVVFIAAQIGLDITWRLSEFASWHAVPYIHRALLLQTYDYVQHHSYTYFQNHPSGTIISKIKGVLDGFEQSFDQLHHQIGRHFLTTLFLILSLLLINIQVFWFMLIWCGIIVSIVYPLSRKLSTLTAQMSESKHLAMGLFSDNILNIFSLFSYAKRQAELLRVKQHLSNITFQMRLKRINSILNYP